MKRTLSVLVILLAIVSMAGAAQWYQVGSDPNQLIPWEEGTNWYEGVVPATDQVVYIEYQEAWFDNVTTFPAICYLNSETTVSAVLVGINANRPGKLQVGPSGVLNCNAIGTTWNGTDRYGTIINEGTITSHGNIALSRKGPAVVKLLGDSVLEGVSTADSFFCQYSGTLDLHMEGNAQFNTYDSEIRNQRLDGDDLQINMYNNSRISVNMTDPANPNAFDSYGNSSINDNASILWDCRANSYSGRNGTLDINDNAVLEFAGTHGGIAGETINVNGGTMMSTNANGGIRDGVINVSDGAVLCLTPAAKALAYNTVTLSGTGIINGWSKLENGSLTMTGGKLGCSTDAAVGNINNNGGTISPNIDGIGGVNIGADLTQSSTASLEIDLDAGTVGSYDSVAVAGAAYLNGTLDLNVNYVPTDGDSYEVLSAASISGTFTNLDATSYVTVGGYPFWVAVGTDSVIATYVADGNAAPATSGGPDQVIDDPNDTTATATLTGSYIDDGRPVPPTYSQTWTQISGDPATIVSPNALTTDVIVPGWGTYIFQLEVSDSSETGTGTVTVLSKKPPIIPVGPLVAYYPFDNDLTDLSGNGFDLILTDASNGGAGNADAVVGGGSLYLGGGTSAAHGGQDLLITSTGRAPAVTVAFFTKKAGEPDVWCSFIKNGGTAGPPGTGLDDYGFAILRPDSGRFKWQPLTEPYASHQYNNGVDNDGDTVADPAIEDGDWHHVACLFDSVAEVSKIYIDGLLRSTQDKPGVGPTLAPVDPAIVIGGPANSDMFWKGLLDEMRVYNVALTDADILALATPPSPCPMDLNGDDFIALDDITEIVLVIKDAPGYSVPAATAPAMDLNGDGSVALDDITEIVLVIKDAPGYSVACP